MDELINIPQKIAFIEQKINEINFDIYRNSINLEYEKSINNVAEIGRLIEVILILEAAIEFKRAELSNIINIQKDNIES